MYLRVANHADFQYTHVYLFCVLHHCASFAMECHGTAVHTETTLLYDAIDHR